jgi:hypothetical protein
MDMREIKFNDVYEAAKILKAIDIKVTKEHQKIKDPMVKGITILKDNLSDIGKAKKEINNFLGNWFGMTGEEFGELSLKDTMNAFKQIKETEGIDTFLNSVKGMMK